MNALVEARKLLMMINSAPNVQVIPIMTGHNAFRCRQYWRITSPIRLLFGRKNAMPPGKVQNSRPISGCKPWFHKRGWMVSKEDTDLGWAIDSKMRIAPEKLVARKKPTLQQSAKRLIANKKYKQIISPHDFKVLTYYSLEAMVDYEKRSVQ